LNGSPDGEFPLPPGYEVPTDEKPFDLSFSNVGKHISPQQREELLVLLDQHGKVFAKNAADFGDTPLMKIRLDIEPGKQPVRQAYRPCAKAHEPFVRETIDRLLKQGVITESESPWAANIVVAKRPRTNQLRLCIDLRDVNRLTIRRNSWPINLIEPSYEKISRSKYRSKLDILSAQVGE
jgi:hypothetical protein